MPIRGVFFDLGDTLVVFKPEVYIDSAQRIAVESGRSIKADDLRKAIKDEWCFRNGEDIQWVNTAETETRYWRAFYWDVLKRLGVDTPSPSVLELLVHRAADPDSFVCFDDTVEVLEALRRIGIAIGLISNAFPSARRIMDKLDLTHWFSPLVLSCEYTCAKPCPEIYRYALDCAGVRPEEALFVDDRLKFTEGAAKTGMRVKLIDRDGLFPSEQDKIYHLRGLLAMIPEELSLCRQSLQS